MMFRNIILICTFSLLTFAFGCKQTGTSETETATEEATTEQTEATTDATAPSGEGFTTEVLQADLPSPRKQMTATMGDLKVVINYGSPSLKGRAIGKEVATFGEVWRTGANEATSIEFSKDVTVEGKPLKAGKYGLFTIPTADQWTIIFNTVNDQWGQYNYDAAKDVLRLTVKPTTIGTTVEQMAFVVENGALVLQWGNLAVPFKVG